MSASRFLLVILSFSCVLFLGPATFASSQNARGQLPDEPPVRDVQLRIVDFDKPQRKGYGEGAVIFNRALEIKLDVGPYQEMGIEPFLYIGTHEIRGHDIDRRKDGSMIKTFLDPRFADLQDGAAIILTNDHGRPIRDEAMRRRAKFRYYRKHVHWTGDYSPPVGAFEDAEVAFVDSRGRPTDRIQPGDPLSIRLDGLPPGAAIQIYLMDDQDQEWSYARLYADSKGNIEPTLFWFHSGVIGTTSRQIDFRPDPSFQTFEEADEYFAAHPLRIELRNLNGELIRKLPFPLVKQRTKPLLYPSNADGVLSNSFQVNQESAFVTGKNFPRGARVGLFVVDNQYDWHDGDAFVDARPGEPRPTGQIVQLKDDRTSFTVEAWAARDARPGTYDIVARILSPRDRRDRIFKLRDNDILSYGPDTGFIYYLIINGNIVIESAGRMRGAPAKFEFSDSFEKHEQVHGAVDPTDVPAIHTGGNYAAYYVVAHQPASYWDAPSPTLTDVSGGTEIKRVKYWCINVSRTNIWNDPNPSAAVSEYDVVVDFGSVAAMTSTDYTPDNVYNKGTDFIDGYNRVGFYILEDPSTDGGMPVGSDDYYDDTFNTPSDPNDPFDFSSIGFSLVRNWFTIRYPAAGAGGTGASLPAGSARYPVVLFMHGRHRICSGVPVAQSMNINCAGTMIPSHKGYNYILDVLASRGFIAISVDTYDIQPSNSSTNYEVRGRLVLEHLNRLRDWDLNGTDPFGGKFQNRIDMTRIGLVGHSRGGEGVVAAAKINDVESATYGHSILAVAAIAPTDQQSTTSWNAEHAPYFLLTGAADGDVRNQGGFRIYDRAFPTGATPQHVKTIAWVYGANHNFFNTIWTPDSLLTIPHGFDWASDDFQAAWTGPRITDDQQRQVALVTLSAYFQWLLMGTTPYREVFTGRLAIASMVNQNIHWTFQDPDRLVIDDFEQSPHSLATNTMGEMIVLTASPAAEEFFNDESWSVSASGFFHETWGARLEWSSTATMESPIRTLDQDVSSYTHLSFRVTQIHDGGVLNPVGNPKNLKVNIFDADGDSAMWDQDTDRYTEIPYPYERSSVSRQYQMKTIRIPLQNFTMNNSGVDLDRIVKVVLTFPGGGLIAIDDLQFTK